MKNTLICGVLVSVLSIATATAAECPLRPWTEFKGTPLLRSADDTAYAYETDHSRVDADGAPNAYHPDDVGKPCRSTGTGLDCPANAGFPGADWWPSVLVPDPTDASRPFVQTSGPFAGFFVTQSWLFDGTKAETDPARFVDATTVPYIVFPGTRFPGMRGTGSKGDVGYAWHTGNGKETAFIVADKGGGGDAKLGEASIAFYEALGGENVNARTGAGVARGVVRFVVFPGSRRAVEKPWPRTAASITEQAKGLVDAAGGADAIAACF